MPTPLFYRNQKFNLTLYKDRNVRGLLLQYNSTIDLLTEAYPAAPLDIITLAKSKIYAQTLQDELVKKHQNFLHQCQQNEESLVAMKNKQHAKQTHHHTLETQLNEGWISYVWKSLFEGDHPPIVYVVVPIIAFVLMAALSAPSIMFILPSVMLGIVAVCLVVHAYLEYAKEQTRKTDFAQAKVDLAEVSVKVQEMERSLNECVYPEIVINLQTPKMIPGLNLFSSSNNETLHAVADQKNTF